MVPPTAPASAETSSITASAETTRLRRGRLTPAGLQSREVLVRRRVIFLGLCLAMFALVTWGIVNVFGAGGWVATEIVILTAFVLGAPWTILGIVNAGIGMWLLHGRRGDAMEAAAPQLAAGETDQAIRTRTAVAMTLRNEPPRGSYEKLVEMRRGLDATDYGNLFDFYILSDTSDPEIAAEEERLFNEMRCALGEDRVHYRRRVRNVGYKAGNVREFLLNEGRDYPFYLPLDSDSLMSAPAVLRLVRIMEAYPRIGILQTLATGLPTKSLFGRLFSFGMRHGMRSFTLGSAWWQGDCGPYWGHNALIRADVFRRHCRLPVLPGKPPLGGHILSHDQIEATLVRRAGFEVRVVPVEGGSWETMPPTLTDHIGRELRWCQGNLQYGPLLGGLRGIKAVSRLQVLIAMMMYVGPVAWMVMTATAISKAFLPDPGGIDLAIGMAMFFAMFGISLVPKMLGMLDVMLTKGGVRAYGGTARFLVSCLSEAIFSILMAPVIALHVSIFVVGLLFGRSIKWGGQNRDVYELSWGDAARSLWPQTLFGAAIVAAITSTIGVGGLIWAAPLVMGLLGAIPFAVFTSNRVLGERAAALGLCAVPEEVLPTPGLGQFALEPEAAPEQRLAA
ncbi:MAG: glucans biosynthesis glucosyltransferase MdoH [Pseudomonadota bacterium]